jgi:hypothetical protein
MQIESYNVVHKSGLNFEATPELSVEVRRLFPERTCWRVYKDKHKPLKSPRSTRQGLSLLPYLLPALLSNHAVDILS